MARGRAASAAPRPSLRPLHASSIELHGGARGAASPCSILKRLWRATMTRSPAIRERYGRFDGLVHNARILGRSRPSSTTTCHLVPRAARQSHRRIRAARALRSSASRAMPPRVRFRSMTSSSGGRRGRAYWWRAMGCPNLRRHRGPDADRWRRSLRMPSDRRASDCLDPGRARTQACAARPTPGRGARLAAGLPRRTGAPTLRSSGRAARGVTGVEASIVSAQRLSSACDLARRVSSRNWPRASARSSAKGPKRVRSTRLTSAPWRSKSWRTSLPLPPRAMSEYQRLAPSPPALAQLYHGERRAAVKHAAEDAVELRFGELAAHAHAEFARRRRAARCRRAASSPSEVTSSRPPSMRGMGLTAMKRRPARLRQARPHGRIRRLVVRTAEALTRGAMADEDAPPCGAALAAHRRGHRAAPRRSATTRNAERRRLAR